MSLDSFDPAVRAAALANRLTGAPAAGGGPELVNLHIHSFFSFNAEGWSPTRVAWESRCRGLYAAGLCDFDVLDGLEEFLEASVDLELRGCVHLETRAFVPALSGVDINSPGEHGVTYAMGAGFASVPEPGTPARDGLDRFRATARERNLALVDRMARAFPAVTLDYTGDVLPLTPAGVATERHIVRAFVDQCLGRGEPEATRLLGELLAKAPDAVAKLVANRAALEEAVRSRLVKRGGLAYREPDSSTFPPLEVFFRWVRSCGAIPMTAWLDGTSGGEADAGKLLDHMAAAGGLALNIIPDRNWNVPDPADRERKTANLRSIVAAATARDIPINIGTEMNRAGLPPVDDLEGSALREHRDVFLKGARIMVGHSLLHRYAAQGYTGEAAAAEWPRLRERNTHFESVGALPPLDRRSADALREAGPARAGSMIRDAVTARRWPRARP